MSRFSHDQLICAGYGVTERVACCTDTLADGRSGRACARVGFAL